MMRYRLKNFLVVEIHTATNTHYIPHMYVTRYLVVTFTLATYTSSAGQEGKSFTLSFTLLLVRVCM